MNRPALLASAAAALSAAAPACAMQAPQPCGASEPRIRCVPYDPAEVVRVPAAVGGSLAIEFSEGETIEDASVSDNGLLTGEGGSPRSILSVGGGQPAATADRNLQMSRRKNFLFLKPLRELAPQSVNVVTVNAEGKVRPYSFQLETRPGGMGPEVDDTLFRLRFRYPADEAAVRRARWDAQREAREARAAADRLRAGTVSGESVRNARYNGQGTAADRAALAPSSGGREPAMWDDGYRTYLRYAGNRRLPMVYQVLPDGRPGLVGQSADADPTTRGTLVTLHGVFPALQLRDGKAVLCVVNRGWDGGQGRNPGTGTASPDVVREAVPAKEDARVR